MVQLARPVTLGDRVAPACFPQPGDTLTETFPEGQVSNSKEIIIMNEDVRTVS